MPQGVRWFEACSSCERPYGDSARITASAAGDESARQAMAAVRAVMGWMYEAGHLEALPPAPLSCHAVISRCSARGSSRRAAGMFPFTAVPP